MKKLLVAGTLGLALMNTSVFAYDYTYSENEAASNGFESIYVGASAGISGGDIGQSCDDQDMSCLSWKAYAGYRGGEHWAVEGAYHNWLSDRSSHDLIRKDVSALSLSVLGIASLSELDILANRKDVEVFGKMGFAAWNSEGNLARYNDCTDFLLGGGAQMKLNENLGIRGEMEYIGGDVDSTNYNAGLTYSTF